MESTSQDSISVTERNVIMENNRINPHPGEEYVGALLRKIDGMSKKWRAFVYVKKGIFLEEFIPSKNRLMDSPREVIDINGLRIQDQLYISNLSKSELSRVFTISARNGRVVTLMAATIEEKTAWIKVLSEYEEKRSEFSSRTRSDSLASNIAPVRRRQNIINNQKTLKRKKIALVETDARGTILKFNDVAESMFEYNSVEIVGQSIKKLMPEKYAAKHDQYMEEYPNKPFGSSNMVGKYRRLEGQRKFGEIFPIQIFLENTPEGTFIARIVEVNKLDIEEMEKHDEYRTIINLRLRLIEAKDLAQKKHEKHFDPYSIVMIDNEKKASTSTKYANVAPFWGEEYFFDDIGQSAKLLKIVINNQHKSQAKDPRHGQVVIDLKIHQNGKAIEKWHSIMPIKSEIESKNLGSMRIKTTLISEKILPFEEYSEFLELILDDELIIANSLASVAGNQLEEFAGTMVNIFAMENRVIDFIKRIASQEIQNTESVYIIFRGNSLTTKVIDVYMKMIGLEYLKSVLYDLLLEIYKDEESCEIDPTKAEKNEDLTSNLQRLLIYCNRFFDAISSSAKKFPPELSVIFENIRQEVSVKWPDNDLEKYTSVSGFLFLRFFCPAILNPHLFGIMDDHPSGTTARTLTLIAKTLQNLANLVEVGVDKEPFMDSVNPFIKENMEKMRSLINRFSKPPTKDPNKFEKIDQRELRRELAALYRHFADKKEELKSSPMKDSPKFSQLSRILDQLEEKHVAYELKRGGSVRHKSLNIDDKERFKGIEEEDNLVLTPY